MSGGFSPAAVRGTALTVHHDRWHPRHAVLSTKSHPRPTQTSTPVCGRSVSLMLVVMSRDVHVLEIDFSAELAKAAGKTTQRVPPHELGARLTNKLFSMLYCTNITTEQYFRPKQYRGFFPRFLSCHARPYLFWRRGQAQTLHGGMLTLKPGPGCYGPIEA